MRYVINDAMFGRSRWPCIVDRHRCVYAYGPKFEFGEFRGSHRATYTHEDAQAVCDWLHERDRSYPIPCKSLETWPQ